ncbi:hypothetical protein ES703_116071 [subsurface metagenome]
MGADFIFSYSDSLNSWLSELGQSDKLAISLFRAHHFLADFYHPAAFNFDQLSFGDWMLVTPFIVLSPVNIDYQSNVCLAVDEFLHDFLAVEDIRIGEDEIVAHFILGVK